MKVLSKLLKIVGGVFIFLGLAGAIVGSFDYVMVFKGQELPQIDWPTGLICAGIGIVFFGIGWMLTKKYGDIDAEAPVQATLDMNNLGFIHAALKKTRKRNLIMGIFLGLFGLAMVILPIQLDEGTGVTIGLMIFGALCLLIAILMFSKYNELRNIETSKIYKLIMHTPQQITALDLVFFKSGFGKVGQAINATIIVDKKMKGVLSITETDAELLNQYLLKHNPNLEVTRKVQTA